MRMKWSCIVEGDAEEVGAFMKHLPTMFANSAIQPELVQSESEGEGEGEGEPETEAATESESEVEVEADADEAPVEAEAVSRFQPPIKDRVVTFLEGRTRAKLKEIADGIGAPASSVARPLRELQELGSVRKVGRRKIGAPFTLVREDGEGRMTDVQALRAGKSDWDNFIPILNALVDQPLSTINQLREATGIGIDILESRLSELRKRGLVKENGKRFDAVSATRRNQLERPKGVTLRDLVLKVVEAHPAETSQQIACRLGASYGEVARRLSDLKKTKLEMQGRDKTTGRWIMRQEAMV